jgi:hypothetical protein
MVEFLKDYFWGLKNDLGFYLILSFPNIYLKSIPIINLLVLVNRITYRLTLIELIIINGVFINGV